MTREQAAHEAGRPDWLLLPATQAEGRTWPGARRWYFDGRKCRRGHISPRQIMGGACLVCDQPHLLDKPVIDRVEAATAAGHPEWAELPARMMTAEETGVTRYFTGEPCQHGHIAPRSIFLGCVVCRREYDAKRRAKGVAAAERAG